jgi:2-hydroxy-3-keto-5-methylthiopentenyl-1-phosphate phosphatase
MSASDPSSRRLASPECEGGYTALLDFDGTVAPDDPTDRILERFADPEWRAIEAEWQGGRITSQECMQRQVALLRATPRQLDAAIRSVRLDPEFHGFVSLCRRRGVDVTIVSDGFDRVVQGALRRARLPIRFFANALESLGGDRWHLSLPYYRSDCRSGAANCKCAHGMGLWRLGRCIVVGDGRSDFCMAARADFVIAKGALADFCRAQGLAHVSFRNFGDATRSLAEWLDRRGARPGGRGPAARGRETCL